MSTTKDEALLLPTEQLRAALAAPLTGCERAWTDGVIGALAALEQNLWWHRAAGEATEDGLFGEVDQTRPTIARQVGDLREEHTDLLGQLRHFRRELEEALRKQETRPDYGELRLHGEQFVAILEEHRQHERELVIESVTTDLGAGD